MFGFKPLRESMLMSGFGPPPGGGGGAGGLSLDELQRIATQLGIDPFKLSVEEQQKALDLLDVSKLLGKDPSELKTIQQLAEMGFLTPSKIQELLFGEGGSGGSGVSYPPAHMDPRYWDLQYKQLYQDALNMGLDSESARRQALATLITNRNNTAVDVANTSASVAKTAAEFAANPRDAVAELFYRNQVGGSTPFGDLANDNFGQYGKTLAEKAASIFQPVAADLNQARTYRDAIPPIEFLGPETRTSLGLPLTTAQNLVGGGMPASSSPQAAAPQANPLQAMMDRLNAMTDQEKNDFRKWVTVANGGVPPPEAEAGVNLNIHEPAMVIGAKSGRIYTTLAEVDPEQLIVKPIPSVQERKKEEKQAAAAMKKATPGVTRMQDGGTVNATPDDFMEQLNQLLARLGGGGGGTGGYSTPLPSPRLLAGAPWSSLEDDPVAMDYALAGYSALGFDPRTIAATVAKFTPKSAQRVGQTAPRVSFA